MHILSRGGRRRTGRAFGQRAMFEQLEKRQMLSLLGIIPNPPLIPVDGNGTLNYTASTKNLVSSAAPTAILFPDGTFESVNDPTDFELNISVNNDGTLAGSGTAANDLSISGWIDTNNDGIMDAGDYTGVLLTGTIVQFGYQDEGGGVALYDFRFNTTGGALDVPGLFQGQDIGLNLDSEASSFVDQNPGDPGFTTDFLGGAKGIVGAITPLNSISGRVYYDANDNGMDDTEPGINGATVMLTGTDSNNNPVSLVTTTSTIGGVAGSYTFGNLNPGTYTVTETTPAGYLDGITDTAGTLGGTVTTDQISNVVIPNDGNSYNATGYEFANILPATLSGNVYNDLNGNGFDNSEPGLGSVPVTLTGNNDLGQFVSVTVNSAADGTYQITGLRPGTYTVMETPPAGFTGEPANAGSNGGSAGNGNVSNITINSGQATTNYNFGQYQKSSIAGNVYLDSNDNGVDNSEPGIGGVTVTLTGTDNFKNAVALTTTTAPNGTYSFGNLNPGTYSVAETQPAGYLDRATTAGSLGGTATNNLVSSITVGAAQNGTSYNFGEVQPASVAGNVYVDSNDNGVDNAEPGIGSVTISLTGVSDLGQSVSLTTTTAANGTYSFTGLRPGTYSVAETQPAGYLEGTTSAGSLGGTATNDLVSNVVAASGAAGTSYNFGEVLPVSIAGNVYVDVNDNGADNAEPGIGSVTITLTGTNDQGASVTQTTTTAANGTYSFAGLRPGTYSVAETQPAGYLEATTSAGSLGGTATNDLVTNIVGGSGAAGTNYNFGELLPSSISGNVYLDSNSNDVDNSEPGIGSVTITLTGTNDQGASVTQTTTTAANGTYSFTGLRPGTYKVTETPPAGYTNEAANAGSLGGTAAVAVVSAITVTENQAGTNYNFGELNAVTQSLSGTVYNDLTGNGLSADDTPLSGVVVNLYKDVNGNGVLDASDGSPIATMTTGTNGQYSFTNLPVGSYIVSETTPSGYVETAPALPDYYAQALTSGQKITNLNFDNFMENCNISNLQNVTYKINNAGCITTVTDLRGNTAQGETVTVTFTIPAGTAPHQYTLVSYNAPDSFFNASDASQQTEYQLATGTFGPGTYSLTVALPSNYYQIDFVCGAAISQLGPAGSNIFYSAQNRLISADNAGLHDDVDDESATMLFWANLGQSLIKQLGGSSTNTALGNWLATTYPNLFGGTLLGNFTNTTVAAKYMSYYNVTGQKNMAQVMATALNVYASTLSLAGTVGATYGFIPTADGLGDAQFNIGTNGAAFGVANNSTITVTQMLSYANAHSTVNNLYNGITTMLNDAYNEFAQVNGDGGIN